VARLAYLGSPEAAVAPLRALVAAGHDVVLVVSRADTRRGRGAGHAASPVKQAATDLGITVTDTMDDLVHCGAELGVVVAYGRIIPVRVLDELAMVNVHFSLLPRWRGAAPVERAILAGDHETGVSLMWLEEGLDTGAVLRARRVVIDAGEHASALTMRLSALGADMLVEALAPGVEALGPGEPQRGEATYAAKLEPEDFRLDWSRPALELERVVRLDRAWTTFRGERLRVLEAVARTGTAPARPIGALEGGSVCTGGGLLELVEVQPAGKRPLAVSDWLRGVRPTPDDRVGDGVVRR